MAIEDKDYDRIMQLLQGGPKDKGTMLDEDPNELMPSEAAPVFCGRESAQYYLRAFPTATMFYAKLRAFPECIGGKI